MYIENKMFLKINPWQTPHGKAAVSNTNSPTETDKVLAERQEENHSNAVPEKPIR